MDITYFKQANKAYAEVQMLECMIDDVDSISKTSNYASINKFNNIISDSTFNAVEKLDSLKSKLESARLNMIDKYNNVLTTINSMEDKQIGCILFWRHVKGCKWNAVAQKLGSGYTADSVKMQHSRYVKSLTIPNN